jgi:hypothetical protein
MPAAMYHTHKNPARELLAEVQRRTPARTRFVQEAFTSNHRRPVFVKLSELTTETFYLFDEGTAHAFRNVMVDLAGRDGCGRLTISYSFYNEFKVERERLQRVAGKLDRIRVLATGSGEADSVRDDGMAFYDVAANPLARYSFVMKEGARPLLFICRDSRQLKAADLQRSLGFFSVDRELIEEIADEMELLLRRIATTLSTFERLEVLHQTTQRITRELENYSRRMDLAVRRVQRRPDLLTPARFDRIVGQAIAKMEQLKEIPRRALRSIDRVSR